MKKLTGEEIDTYAEIVNRAWPALNADKWLREHIEESIHETTYGLFKSKKLVAGIRVFKFELNYNKTSILAYGLGMVAVDILHKKEKNAYHLIQYFIQSADENNVTLAMLYPFDFSFYKKMGFGIGTKVYQFYLKPQAFPDYHTKQHLKELTVKDSNELLEFYNKFFYQTHGMTKRILNPSELERPFNYGTIIGFLDETKKLKGYLVFSIEERNLYIHEYFYESSEVLKEFSSFLHSQSDQINRIIINSSDDELIHFVSQPESDQPLMINFPSLNEHKHIAHIGTGVMYRIINLKSFFEELKVKNHQFYNETLVIKFSIQDSFYPKNSKPIIVSFVKGEISDINLSQFDVEIKMDISNLSSLVMGVANFKTLVRLGLAELSNQHYMNSVHNLFTIDQKPICTKAF
nr:GNAT family N-acetyltransferase [Rummeliibacillus suwonensis]